MSNIDMNVYNAIKDVALVTKIYYTSLDKNTFSPMEALVLTQTFLTALLTQHKGTDAQGSRNPFSDLFN
jgi:hypothetical protein